jgi:hypothetical protein
VALLDYIKALAVSSVLQHAVFGQPLLHYADNATLFMRAARAAGRARQGLELAFTHVGRTSVDGQDVMYVFEAR